MSAVRVCEKKDEDEQENFSQNECFLHCKLLHHVTALNTVDE